MLFIQLRFYKGWKPSYFLWEWGRLPLHREQVKNSEWRQRQREKLNFLKRNKTQKPYILKLYNQVLVQSYINLLTIKQHHGFSPRVNMPRELLFKVYVSLKQNELLKRGQIFNKQTRLFINHILLMTSANFLKKNRFKHFFFQLNFERCYYSMWQTNEQNLFDDRAVYWNTFISLLLNIKILLWN